MNGTAVAAVAVAAYLLIVVLGAKFGLWKRLKISLYGPVLMLRTKRGRHFIEGSSRHRRFWLAYGNLSILVTVVSMMLVTLFLVYEAFKTFSEPLTIESPANIDIRLPGTNPFVTLAYTVIGFAVAIIIHEFTHGTLAVSGRIRLNSIGVLLFVIPIGAFVEPDDKELKQTIRSKRARLYSAGPASNMFAAAICLLLLVGILGPAAKPVLEGAVVTGVTPDSPAEVFGIHLWSEVTSVKGTTVTNASQVIDHTFGEPGDPVVLEMLYKSDLSTVALPGGIVVTEVFDGPAYNIGIMPGMIIKSLDDQTIHSVDELRAVIENSTRDAPVNITVLKYGYDKSRGTEWFVEDPGIRHINLTSKWIYYYTHYPNQNKESYRNVSFMAVSTAPFGIEFRDTTYLTDLVGMPFADANGVRDTLGAGLRYVALPFLGYAPISSPAADLYEPSGVLGFLPHQVYWVLMNLIYWLFWVNFMVGITNVLPALPMDGGYVFKDVLKTLSHRWGLRLTGLDRAIGRRPMTDDQINWITIAVTGFILIVALYLVLWQLFGPIS